ncbi:MAG: hypothetical protein IJJ99_10435 [Oscillospiraceae bacterium]|nr:hypothetical protein [Oscillospiraceae bacterium]
MSSNNKSAPSEKYKISLDKAWSLSKNWKRSAIMWRVFDHAFAILAFACSMIVVYVSSTQPSQTTLIIILSSVSALLTLTGFACNPSRYMKAYRYAYQILNEVLVEQTDSKGQLIDQKTSMKAIQKAIVQGEKHIGLSYDMELELCEEKK